MSTVSPPRLTRQFQLASDPGLHHPPVLCGRETNLLPSLNAFLFSLYQKYTLLRDLSRRCTSSYACLPGPMLDKNLVLELLLPPLFYAPHGQDPGQQYLSQVRRESACRSHRKDFAIAPPFIQVAQNASKFFWGIEWAHNSPRVICNH